MMRLKEIPREIWGYVLALFTIWGIVLYEITTNWNNPELALAISKPRFDILIMVGGLIIIATISKRYEEWRDSKESET